MKPKLILDSGAFSAWKLGRAVDLEAYCDYIKKNEDWIDNYVALDVINPNDPDVAASASFDNLVYMRKRGLSPIPVFHVGEDISWLLRMLDLGCKYIGLSASSIVSRGAIDLWYAFAWSHLVTRDGLPAVKVHAFGEGRYETLKRFPWASADNSNWIWMQRNGKMTLPNGQLVAARNDRRNVKSEPDIDMLSPEEDAIFADILRKAGVSRAAFAERAHDAMVLRSYVSVKYYMECQAKIRALHPVHYRPSGFLAKPVSKAAIDWQFDYYMVVSSNPSTFPIMAKLQYPYILYSYFYIGIEKSEAKKTLGTADNLRLYMQDPVKAMDLWERWQRNYQMLEKYVT